MKDGDFSSSSPVSVASVPELDPRTIDKVLVRLIPFMVFLYIFNYLDRVNVAFAELDMSRSLGFSRTVYGFGAGIFFLGYFIFEVPSNLIMQRVGARLWMARIMITWGLISSAMMFVTGKWSFYTLRLLLGLAEAGFAPGVLLYLTWWLPMKEQARAVAWFLTSTALAGVIGSPVAGLLLKMDGVAIFGYPLSGWQWLFLLEGIPSVILGIVILFLLPDRPRDARWLSAREREALSAHLEQEHRARETHGLSSIWSGLTDPGVWLFNIIYCMLMFGFQGCNYWMPRIIKTVTRSASNVQVGFLTAIPFAAAIIAMVIVGRHSDRSAERRWHVAICSTIGALGMLGCAATSSPVLAIACLSIAAAGIWSTLGPFWALPPLFLGGSAAAAGIALINSIGNLGGGFGPWIMGYLWDRTLSYRTGLLIDAAVLLIGAILVLLIPRRSAPAQVVSPLGNGGAS